jgi:hypothetical protein
MTKYVFAYLLTALLVGLGVFIVCRPSRRRDAE